MSKEKAKRIKKNQPENPHSKMIEDYRDDAKSIISDAITYFMPNVVAMNQVKAFTAAHQHSEPQIKAMMLKLFTGTGERDVRMWYMAYLLGLNNGE